MPSQRNPLMESVAKELDRASRHAANSPGHGNGALHVSIPTPANPNDPRARLYLSAARIEAQAAGLYRTARKKDPYGELYRLIGELAEAVRQVAMSL